MSGIIVGGYNDGVSDEWDDPMIDADSRRYSQLATVLRARTLVDVDCYSQVPGRPFMPMGIATGRGGQ